MIRHSRHDELEKNPPPQEQFIQFWAAEQDLGYVGRGCMCQFWKAEMRIDGVLYPTAEHFMMAEKARTFEDELALAEIMKTDCPLTAKSWGRKVSPEITITGTRRNADVSLPGRLASLHRLSNLS